MKVYVINQKVFVFNAEDASILRQEHRIAGNLIGCFARKPRQNAHLGLPLQLMPEEATLLKEKSIAELVGQSSQLKTSTKLERQQYKQYIDTVYKDQAEICHVERLADIKSRKKSILAGKKAKRMKLLKDKQSKGENTETDETDEQSEEQMFEEIKPSPLPQTSTLIQIPTESWRPVQEEPVSWLYPCTDQEKLRYRVFKKLWEDGYFLTCGGKFGGDFLVYPGDPCRYHSYYIAICMLPTEGLSASHLANMGRLAVTVKKTVILCSLDKLDKLTFTSINWSHIS